MIEVIVNLPSPISELQHALYPRSVANQGMCFNIGRLTFESIYTQLLQKESSTLLLMDNPSINFFFDRAFKLLAFRCLNL